MALMQALECSFRGKLAPAPLSALCCCAQAVAVNLDKLGYTADMQFQF